MTLPFRYWEIDFLRGIAILLMIVLHFFVDLSVLQMYEFPFSRTIWSFWQKTTAAIFLLLVGICLIISHHHEVQHITGKEARLFSKYLKRGLVIFSYGLLITIVTRIYLKEGYVVFGVLHLIGATIILSYPLLTLRYLNLFLGAAVIIVGFYLNSFHFTFPWLLWAGFRKSGFYSVDYFPIFPWLGFVLIGLFLGEWLYSPKGRMFPLNDCSQLIWVRCFCYLGKHSLKVYLIHQPLFVMTLTFMKHFMKKGL